MKDATLEKRIKAITHAIDHIAFVRRMTEVDGYDISLFDAEVDRLCTEYHDKYAKMDEIHLMIHGIAEILKSDKAEEFVMTLEESLKE